MADPLRQSRVDRVLTDIPFCAVVIRRRILVLGELPTLQLILMRRVPRPRDDLATASHRLRIRRHHANRTRVMQHVFRGDGLRADPAIRKRNVLGDILRQVVARHHHVQVLVDRVARVRLGWVRAAREHVDVLHERDHVRGVAAAGAFDVVCVHRAPFEG